MNNPLSTVQFTAVLTHHSVHQPLLLINTAANPLLVNTFSAGQHSSLISAGHSMLVVATLINTGDTFESCHHHHHRLCIIASSSSLVHHCMYSSTYVTVHCMHCIIDLISSLIHICHCVCICLTSMLSSSPNKITVQSVQCIHCILFKVNHCIALGHQC